ncbi:MAG: MFS transporter [Sulfobacillus sp.]
MKPPQPQWYALGNLGSNIFSQAFATFALFFYIDHLRGPVGAITAALAVQSLWHAVLNPIIGQLSDRTRTRYGRRIPYIAGLSIPLGVIFFLLWHPLVSASNLAWYFLIVVMLFDFTYLAVVLNWTSLFPEMFRSIQARSRAQASRQAVGIVALMVGVAAPPLLYGRLGWTSMGLILGVIGTAGFLLSLKGAKEATPLESSPSHWNWVEPWTLMRTSWGFQRFLGTNFLVQLTLGLIPAVLPFYAKYVLHTSHSMLSLLLASIFVVALIAVVPWTRWIRKRGSHLGILWAIGWLAMGVTPFIWAPDTLWVFSGCLLLGIGLAGFLVLADVLIAEVIDQDAQIHGTRREGLFYGINGFILRLGVSVQALLLYLALHFSHYHANTLGFATTSVRWGLRGLAGVIPLMLLIMAWSVIRHFDVPPSPSEHAPSAAS